MTSETLVSSSSPEISTVYLWISGLCSQNLNQHSICSMLTMFLSFWVKEKKTFFPFFIVVYKIILDKKIWTQGLIRMDVTSCEGKRKCLEIKTSHWLFSINLKKSKVNQWNVMFIVIHVRTTLWWAKPSTIDQIIYSKGSRMTYKLAWCFSQRR